jgi:hypothetical protein
MADDIKPDNQAAIDFLQKWAPEGPWVLTSIQTDRQGIGTGTFYPASLPALGKWLDAYNGKRNIYFHVNPPMRDLTKKAEREDIKSVDWLHVDIDPRAGEDLEEERKRALALLTTNLPEGVPAPTCVVFSGGGYQGFWRLEESIPIDGDLPKAEDAKRYNMQLELLFGADNCHNIDRIMRLPGTVNLPDARKAKKGRVPTLATLIEFSDTSYPLSKFTAAPAVQLIGDAPFGGGGGGETVKVSGNVERIDDTDELNVWDVPDRVKIIMAQGNHPDQPKGGDDSRSAWLFDFCCQMIRHNVPDEVIFSIITDPQWAISASVVEHKGNTEKYAIKQIESAKLHAIDPMLVYFNNKYAVIKKFGGKCLVVEEAYDHALERKRLIKMSLENLEKGYENQQIQVGEDNNGNPKFKPAGTWWRKHPKRRQYETIVFAPEKQVPDDCYNLWKGFAVQSIPGDCSLFLDHVRINVCSGNEEHYDYLFKWMARAVQHPGTPGEVAIVLRGGRGTGKSFFAKMFGSLFGCHFMQVSNSGHLVGNFNSHLRDLVVLFADEAFYAGDKKHESILKTLVTEELMAIEAKGVDVENAPNYIHLIMASNDMHVIPAGGDERRFFVTDVGEDHQQDGSYFAAVAKQMDSGGREALLHTLLTHDISEFNVRHIPASQALQEQKLLSLRPDAAWWYEALADGRLLREQEGWPSVVVKNDLVDDYVAYTQRFGGNRQGNQISLGKFLHRICPKMTTVQQEIEVELVSADGWTRKKKKKVPCYVVPNLEDCRAAWNTVNKTSEAWLLIPDQDELTQAGPPF